MIFGLIIPDEWLPWIGGALAVMFGVPMARRGFRRVVPDPADADEDDPTVTALEALRRQVGRFHQKEPPWFAPAVKRIIEEETRRRAGSSS